MDRRRFLQGIAVSAAGLELLDAGAEVPKPATQSPARKAVAQSPVSVDGFTLVSEFTNENASWKAYEDLRSRDGALLLLSSSGRAISLPKSAEASTPQGTPYLG